MEDLKGKTAIITGSTSGIGLQFAHGLASKGVNIMLNGFGDAGEIETARKEIEEQYGVKAAYNGADMTKPDQIAELIKETKSAFGSLDILINNAGIQKVSPIEDFPDDKWDAIIAINLSSSFHTIKHAVPIMKQQGSGRIINLASVHGLVASPYKSAYVAAKHGVIGLTKTVALEVAEHGITCNAICPGYVETPLVQNQIADTAKARGMTEEEVKNNVMLEAQPSKEFITYAQLNGLLFYLCSDAGGGANGASFNIDGGWVAK
ncbi:3-hydroxybutyrate dehydrogenase [Aquisalinus flavus]|uniref:3-hydroxybutyrate dehydrogenase n=1 Tax=Aquisalinus flavus TaxID=1526572 RepID=A0A8J2V4Q7_9PROT|nr:3-hydroxybutyrate dehydrogenase [Aquisalinus flavus]MBD0427221.1 3-hydroxybutyrate dehydrogenase [Aquisalinus flavus]UNE47036.1 3-hydroxybutyrate dehydrogenase [Aquisalinus flavus]GGC99290.1 3-hydroxybutyrate dehydrogenase [Aquisalinus flavus]